MDSKFRSPKMIRKERRRDAAKNPCGIPASLYWDIGTKDLGFRIGCEIDFELLGALLHLFSKYDIVKIIKAA